MTISFPHFPCGWSIYIAASTDCRHLRSCTDCLVCWLPSNHVFIVWNVSVCACQGRIIEAQLLQRDRATPHFSRNLVKMLRSWTKNPIWKIRLVKDEWARSLKVIESGGNRQDTMCASKKGKERKSIYIAPFCTKVHTKRSGTNHTVLPANNTMPVFPSWRSPDVATTATEAADIQLQLTTHLSIPKGWKADLA